ncbi:MAG: hypothetical protein FJ368_02555 [Pelagibacterales bacterium]|nr:hypothetical protein [Pelagibacterales bacterium]
MRKNILKSGLLLASFCSSFNAYSQIDLSSSDKFGGITSLMSATIDGDLEGVRFFARNNPTTVNQKNLGGATALNIAARVSDFEIAKVLVEKGANVNSSDNEGWTPLMRASLSKNKDIVNLLLNNGASTSKINYFGESAIIHASFSDCNECLFLILILDRMNHFSDKITLRQQINDAFVVARNHDNKDSQSILENALDRVENGNQNRKISDKEIGFNNQSSNDSSTVVEENMPLITELNGKKFKFQQGEEVKKPTYSDSISRISEDSNKVEKSIKTILEDADDKKQKQQQSSQPSKKYVFTKVEKESSDYQEKEESKEEKVELPKVDSNIPDKSLEVSQEVKKENKSEKQIVKKKGFFDWLMFWKDEEDVEIQNLVEIDQVKKVKNMEPEVSVTKNEELVSKSRFKFSSEKNR